MSAQATQQAGPDSAPVLAMPESWLGRQEVVIDQIAPQAVEGLAATLDWARAPRPGERLPPGWHWLFFNPHVRQSQLGSDGHPLRTPDTFLPPIDLPRRMWAGGRIRYLRPIRVGSEAVRTSRIERVVPKHGKSGAMCFFTVVHSIAVDGLECIVEEQDIVYREAAASSAQVAPGAARSADARPAQARWQRTFRPDAVLLFRYSALTFNGHRIHYDTPYARATEHYEDLVVHGPLLATLLQMHAQSTRPTRRLAAFEFRGLQAVFVDRPLTLCADEASGGAADDGALVLRVLTPTGEVGMEASAHFTPEPEGGAR